MTTSTDHAVSSTRAEASVRTREEHFEGGGGLKIFFRSWRGTNAPRAVLVAVHGFKSHSGYFQWPGEHFAASGLAVYALDHRGRGQSEGERFFVDHISEYVDDVATFVQLVKAREPGLPVFVIGHSAGGVISCVYTLEHQAEITGLICHSFAYRVPAPDFVLAVVKGISHLWPHVPVLKLPNEQFSRDPKVVEAMNNDALLAGEVQPAETVAAMVRADERLEQEFPQITLPVLIVHGTLDQVTKPEGSKLFHAAAGSQDKTLKLYEGHFHDLLGDTDKELVAADMLSWIDAHLPRS
jgi:acylglycerol lipase